MRYLGRQNSITMHKRVENQKCCHHKVIASGVLGSQLCGQAPDITCGVLVEVVVVFVLEVDQGKQSQVEALACRWVELED